MSKRTRWILVFLSVLALTTLLYLPFTEAKRVTSGASKNATPSTAVPKTAKQPSVKALQDTSQPYSAEAVTFVETPALRDLNSEPLTPEQMEKFRQAMRDEEKNEANTRTIKAVDPTRTAPFWDPTLITKSSRRISTDVVTNPIQNFDGPDMDFVSTLFGSRFAPPDTNASPGPNHVVITTNSVVQVFNKTGTPLTQPVRISTLLAGIPHAGDDDGDPIVLYDPLADRWLISQFNLTVTNNSTAQHIAISKTPDPTGQYFAYSFPMVPGRLNDYPHFGVWPDGYYMSTNDFNFAGTAFLGAGLYAFERNKMLVGDPTAKVIAFSTDATHGGMLPTNLQGLTPPPIGTPNLFWEWDADEFGAAFDLVRTFAFSPNYAVPGNSTLTQGPDIPTAPFDARNPSGRADIQQPAPGEGLDSIADRFMHAVNFRVLPGGVQSFVMNFTVNVSGVNPTSSALYQAGVRWMETRRNPATGAITINQQATYAPGAGNGTGRDLWMASVAQDGEGNIGLGASASAPGPAPAALNPTAIYTGRVAGDPVNTLPQGEVDAMSAVTRGVQTATANRWGDYSSLFVDPADDCTFWGAFEYVDSPTATFDWNTRIFSFKVNPQCVTSARGTFSGTVTNCVSGLPIQGAIVTTSNGFFATTDASGNYSILAAPGTYSVSITKPNAGFNTATGNVTVNNGANTVFNACLQPSPIIVSAGATIVAESCQPANGAIDPGETVTVSLCVQNTGGLNTTNLQGTLQASGGVTNIQPPNPQTYGVVVAGGGAVCRNFTFTANGTCGGTLTASLQLQDGATNLGTLTYTFTLGMQRVAFSENFDGVTPPNLPAGWTTGFTNGDGDCTVGGPLCGLGSNWATVSTSSDTAPNSVFHNDPSCVTDNVLDSPGISIISNSPQLTFRHSFNLESTFDGTVLEVSSPNINGGAFTDITNAAVGGSFVSGGYTQTISTAFLSPIAGRQAWSGNSGGYITTVANLGPNLLGQTIKLRFRFASDCSVSATGHNIDTIRLTDGFNCCGVVGTPDIRPGTATLINESCPPANNAIDPGERVSVSLQLRNQGTGATTNLVATLLPGPGVIAPSGAQTYGAIAVGGSASRDFAFTADAVCGSNITLTVQLQDGATNLGTVTYTMSTGTQVMGAPVTFSNSTPIAIPNVGTATPYPSNITVSGLPSTIGAITVTLSGLAHTFPDDIDVLLVSPTGRKMIIMSDAGGLNAVTNVTITLDDAAATAIPDSAALTTGSFKPANYLTVQDPFAAPAPAGPYLTPAPGGSDTLTSAFTGAAGGDPNGTWSLYVVDDASGDLGSFAGGWSISLTPLNTVCTTPCGQVRLDVTSTLTRTNSTTVSAVIRVTNIGSITANNVVVSTARLGAANGAPVPQTLGNIAPGATVTVPTSITFTNSTPGASSTLSVAGTYTGGTFSSNKRVTIP